MKNEKSRLEITFNEWAAKHKVSTMWDNTKIENRRFIKRLNNAREYWNIYAK
jgi:cupin superfamily acireductone dioxygenase involved in methionine salvage